MSKFNFITILFIGFVDYLGIALIYPVFAALLFDTNYSIIPDDSSAVYRGAILGLLIGLTPITQFFSSPILGVFSDLKGRKLTLIFGTILGCSGYLLAAIGIWNHSLLLLIIYRILVGISGGTVGVAQAMIADISNEKNKARRFSLFNACAGIGFTVGPFLGGKLTDPSVASWCGYSAPFLTACVMCFINFLMILYKFPESHKVKENMTINLLSGLRNIRKVFLWDKLRWLFLATFAFSFGWSFFNEFIPVFLRKHFEFSPGDVGNYYAYGGAWYALSAGIGGASFLKAFSPDKIIVKALMGSAVCMLGFIVIQDAQFIWWILPILMYCLSLIYPNLTAIVSNQATKENQGEVLGVYQSVIACAMGLSPLLVGSAIGAYPELTAWGGAFTMLLASFAFWMRSRKTTISLSLAKE